MALSCVQILLMVGMLVTGSINTLSKKAQNDCIVEGFPDAHHNHTASAHSFDHPWFQTIIMFMGEMLCLFGLCVMRKRERDAFRLQTLQSVSDGEREKLEQPRIFQWIFVIPTVCDLVGTSLAGIGLVYVDASVWQMLRGSIIIFAGILSRIFLKRKLTFLHWTGMFVTMIGLVLVGISSVFKNKHSSEGSKAVLGIVLIVVSQLVSASQMVIEELFLKKRGAHPLQVVGMEGTFGFSIMALAVLPAMYFIPGPQVNNSYENSLDAMYQIANDYKLLIFCLLYLFSIAFYNYFGLAVTKSLTAVHRTLIDACRTLLVWAVDLLIFYAFGGSFGEPFDKYWGILQVDGFLFLLIGTALYNQLIDLSWLPCDLCKPRPPPLEFPGSHDNRSPHRKGQIQEESYEDEVQPDYVDERTRLLHENTHQATYER